MADDNSLVPSGGNPLVPQDVIREQDKVMLVLSYLGLLALVPLLTVNDSAYVKWHAKQGLALCVTWVAFALVTGILSAIPLIGILFGIVAALGHIGFLALVVMGIIKALEPNRWKIPVVGDIAAKF